MKPWFGRVVHDLKGPLSPLQTAAYLLRGDQLAPERQKELLDVLERQTRRLNALLGELGEWGRAEGQPTSARTKTPLPVLLDLALGSLPACAIDPVYEDGTDALDVDGEQSALVSLFAVLIGHACARDPAHTPTLRARRDGARLAVLFEDTGPALPPEQRAVLFDEPQKQPADDGLGLRLLTAAAIVQRHGGRLVAEDTGETGLRVRCELPLPA